MRLKAFRVQNYKKIRDTGWISVRDLTALVGKNEAGKSAVLRGLSKLNPSDGEKYDGLKEFPRRRFTVEFQGQDWPVASARFRLTPDEQRQLADICPVLGHAGSVVCTRRYSGSLYIDFEPVSEALLTRRELIEGVGNALSEIQAITTTEAGEALDTLKASLVSALNPLLATHETKPQEDLVTKGEVDQFLNAVSGKLNEPWQRELFDSQAKLFRDFSDRAGSQDKLASARAWIAARLPKFVYFDRYDVLDSAIHLPALMQQLQTNPNAPRVRTTLCLFKQVGLDLAKLAALAPKQAGGAPDETARRAVDERAIYLSSASTAMTQQFRDWWEQRKHAFRYQADGDYLRVWVSDDLDPSEIELDQRSVGMQYFFSFFTVFLVETQGAHKTNVLLLDEPGLHTHGSAQAKIVKFLEKLAKDNQMLYSTHSPFMLDADHLENIRAVYEDEDGTTRISEDIWPRDKDALFPLQAALGYQLAQSLFLSKHQLIVEGLTDYWLLKALAQALSSRRLPSLRNDVVIVPAAGLTKLLPLASMLIGQGVQIAALLDGDEPARREGKKLVQKLLAGEDRRCLFIGDFADAGQHAEIEDLFPEDEYVSAVEEAHPGVGVQFNEEEHALAGVVNKVAAFFERTGIGEFEKWRSAAVLRDRITGDPTTLPPEVLGRVGKVFEAINACFQDNLS